MTAIVVAERITGSSAVRGRVVTGARAGMSVREPARHLTHGFH